MSEVPPGPKRDRRAHTRVPITVREARCIAGMEVFFGYAHTVSRGGLFIATAAPGRRTLGEVIEIQFELPGGAKRYRCKARVAWTRSFRSYERGQPPGFGVEFVDLPEEHAAEIEEWVRTHPDG